MFCFRPFHRLGEARDEVSDKSTSQLKASYPARGLNQFFDEGYIILIQHCTKTEDSKRLILSSSRKGCGEVFQLASGGGVDG